MLSDHPLGSRRIGAQLDSKMTKCWAYPDSGWTTSVFRGLRSDSFHPCLTYSCTFHPSGSFWLFVRGVTAFIAPKEYADRARWSCALAATSATSSCPWSATTRCSVPPSDSVSMQTRCPWRLHVHYLQVASLQANSHSNFAQYKCCSEIH